MFDVPRKMSADPVRPYWVENENEIRLYTAIMSRIEEIEDTIANATAPLKPAKYRISASAICKAVGLSGGYISKHPKFLKFVNSRQDELRKSAHDVLEKSKQSGYRLNSPEHMRREELVRVVKELTRRAKERDSEHYVKQLQAAFADGIGGAQVTIRERIKYLERQLADTREQLDRHIQQLRDITNALTASELRRHDLARQLKELGVEPNQTPTLRSV